MKMKPIAITMGEPSGIASEIILKSWLLRRKKKLPPFFLVDCIKKLKKINQLFKLDVKLKSIKRPEDSLGVFQEYLPAVQLLL